MLLNALYDLWHALLVKRCLNVAELIPIAERVCVGCKL